jgi:hypothetical protein
MLRLGHAASAGGRTGASPQGYSTAGYFGPRACSRLAHFQRGCGAAVPRRAISVFDSCFAHAENGGLTLYPPPQVVTNRIRFR